MHAGVQETESIVQRIFGGVLQSEVICSACCHISTAYDPFLDISLDIGAPPLAPPPMLKPPTQTPHRCRLLSLLVQRKFLALLLSWCGLNWVGAYIACLPLLVTASTGLSLIGQQEVALHGPVTAEMQCWGLKCLNALRC